MCIYRIPINFILSLTDAFRHHIEWATQKHKRLFLTIFNYNARYLYIKNTSLIKEFMVSDARRPTSGGAGVDYSASVFVAALWSRVGSVQPHANWPEAENPLRWTADCQDSRWSRFTGDCVSPDSSTTCRQISLEPSLLLSSVIQSPSLVPASMVVLPNGLLEYCFLYAS